MGAYVLATASLKDGCSRKAWADWRSAARADAGLVHGRRGLADAGGLWGEHGTGEAKERASAHRDARAHQHRDLHRDGDGHSNGYPDAEAQTYFDDTAAPAAAPASTDPDALAAYRYPCRGGYGDSHDYC